MQKISTEYLNLALKNRVFCCINVRILILWCQIRLEMHICLNITVAHRLCHSVSKLKCLGQIYESAQDNTLSLGLVKFKFLIEP